MDKPSEETEFSTGCLHPLLIDHVVESILLSVDPKELRSYCRVFRQVCRTWCNASSRVYRKHRGEISFPMSPLNYRKFMDATRTSFADTFPLSSYKFHLSNEKNSVTQFMGVIKMPTCAQLMTRLELIVGGTQFCPCFGLTSWETLANLRTLVFHTRSDDHESAHTLSKILQISPSLESLNLRVALDNRKMFLVSESFAKYVPDGVRDLRIHMAMKDDHIRELCERKALKRIHTLHLYLQDSDVSKETLETFLTVCGNNVRNLRALGAQFYRQPGIELPTFPRMECLYSMGKVAPNVKYEKIFPVLRRIEILWDGTQDIFPMQCWSETVKEVHFPYGLDLPVVIKRMAACFPNLEKLTGISTTNSEVLKAIWGNLRKLRYLSIEVNLPEDELESAITGIGTGSVSIKALQDLQLLSISTESDISITNVMIQKGLQLLRNLRILKIRGSFKVPRWRLNLLTGVRIIWE